jgi:hypothetical protein
VTYSPEETIATPTMAYSALARTTVPAALVCATKLLADGTQSDPFLLVIGAPTAVPGGHTRDPFWTGNLPPTLLPAQVNGPANVSFLTLATTKLTSRSITIPIGQRTPEFYANLHTAACFSEDGALYRLILCESQLVEMHDPKDSTFCSGLSNNHYWFRRKVWWNNNNVAELDRIDIDLQDETNKTRDVGEALLPRMLLLPGPLNLPIGPLGPATLGAKGVQAAYCRLAGIGEPPDFLTSNIVCEWLNAVQKSPMKFATPWLAR